MPQDVADCCDHAVRVRKNIVIPEPHDTESLRFKPARPLGITRLSESVLSAVQFDDQRPLVADEIDDVAADRRLAAELPAVERMIAETVCTVLGLAEGGRTGP